MRRGAASERVAGRLWAGLRGALAAAGVVMWAMAAVPAVGESDRRSQVIAELDCGSEVARQELSLFANGTIRLWEHDDRGDRMRLGELTLDELDAVRSRLRKLDFSETDRDGLGATGDWIVACVLELDLGDGELLSFRYGQFDSLSLALSTAVREVEGLAERVEKTVPGGALPAHYSPQVGDILKRWDGLRFEVISPTVLGEGVELSGVEVPLTIYMPVSELHRFFTEVESRRSPR